MITTVCRVIIAQPEPDGSVEGRRHPRNINSGLDVCGEMPFTRSGVRFTAACATKLPHFGPLADRHADHISGVRERTGRRRTETQGVPLHLSGRAGRSTSPMTKGRNTFARETHDTPCQPVPPEHDTQACSTRVRWLRDAFPSRILSRRTRLFHHFPNRYPRSQAMPVEARICSSV